MATDKFQTYTNFPVEIPYKFSYAKEDRNEYAMLSTAYMAITDTNNWKFIIM